MHTHIKMSHTHTNYIQIEEIALSNGFAEVIINLKSTVPGYILGIMKVLAFSCSKYYFDKIMIWTENVIQMCLLIT